MRIDWMRRVGGAMVVHDQASAPAALERPGAGSGGMSSDASQG